MMRILSWTLRIALFVVLFGLALQNTELTTLRFYAGLAWQLPFIVWLLIQRPVWESYSGEFLWKYRFPPGISCRGASRSKNQPTLRVLPSSGLTPSAL